MIGSDWNAGARIEVRYDDLRVPFGWTATVVQRGRSVEQVEALLGWEPIREALAGLPEDADGDDVWEAVADAVEGTNLQGAEIDVVLS